MNNYLQQIVLLIILALAGWLGNQVKNLYKKYITTKIKQNICRTVVRFVEQVYQDLHGPEKLAQAMAKASEILEGYGITIAVINGFFINRDTDWMVEVEDPDEEDDE